MNWLNQRSLPLASDFAATRTEFMRRRNHVLSKIGLIPSKIDLDKQKYSNTHCMLKLILLIIELIHKYTHNECNFKSDNFRFMILMCKYRSTYVQSPNNSAARCVTSAGSTAVALDSNCGTCGTCSSCGHAAAAKT